MGVLPAKFGLRNYNFKPASVESHAMNARVLDQTINQLPFPQAYQQTRGSNYTLTTTPTSIVSFEFVAYWPQTQVAVDIVCSADHTAAGAGVAVGQAYIDGVAVDSGKATLNEGAVSGTCSQVYVTTVEAGTHTCALYASKTINAGTAVFVAEHTRIRLVSYS